jgi:DNA mismatch repair protein MutS
MEVREWKDAIVFLHKVRPGAADRSYGIQVAKLAGLPAAVTQRAAEVLALLEQGDGKAPDGAALIEELPLFAAAGRIPSPHLREEGQGEGQQEAEADGGASPLVEALAALNPDDLTPKAALETLYQLKELARRTE